MMRKHLCPQAMLAMHTNPGKRVSVLVLAWIPVCGADFLIVANNSVLRNNSDSSRPGQALTLCAAPHLARAPAPAHRPLLHGQDVDAVAASSKGHFRT